MFSSVDEFIRYVPEFDTLTASEMIPYFLYFCNQDNSQVVTPQMIRECFDALSLAPYSNISAYLSRKSSGKNAIFLKKKTGYTMSRAQRDTIERSLNISIELKPTNNLVDLSLLNGTPYYIKKTSEQMNCCYDNGLYDACLVMMRKLFETLIIECYERFSCASEIMDSNGNFYYLSDLIPKYIHSDHWSVSRNFEKYIKNVKKFGDLSAHNRRFLAGKLDIDGFKFDMRQCLQEIILTIDYQSWNKNSHIV